MSWLAFVGIAPAQLAAGVMRRLPYHFPVAEAHHPFAVTSSGSADVVMSLSIEE